MIGKATDLNDGTDQPSVRDLHASYSKSRLLSGKGNGSDLTAVGWLVDSITLTGEYNTR